MYTAQTINLVARAYATAYFQGKLRKNQCHIGLHCATLRNALADVALEQMIFDACGYKSAEALPQRVERVYTDTVELIREAGFNCSVGDSIATKQDITDFLKIPESTLNSFLYKHRDQIHATRLDIATIRSLGRKANRMNGYALEEVAKIVFAMDSEIGIELKRKMFGDVGALANPYTKDEIQWRKILAEIFRGFDFRYSYAIGNYCVDYFIAEMGLVLECNGFSHKYYDPKEEKRREQAIIERYALVRFHPEVSLPTLVNGILRAKAGTVVRLYDGRKACLN